MTKVQSAALSFVLYYQMLEIGDQLEQRIAASVETGTRNRLLERLHKVYVLSVALYDEIESTEED